MSTKSQCEKDCVWNPCTSGCENNKCLENIIDDSVITHDQIIDVTKTIPKNFNGKR